MFGKPFSPRDPSQKKPSDKLSGSHPTDIESVPPAHDDSNWLVSYADMMTLLCGFFIMLFSMATLETTKYDAFKEAIAEQFGGEFVSPSKEKAQFATQIVEELALKKNTTIKSSSTGVSLAFLSTVFFDTSSAELSPQGKTILSQVIHRIMNRQRINSKAYKIVIEGHTDGRPIVGGYYLSNWELSAARATRVLRMFLDYGFAADHVTAIGYADTHPLIPERTPDGHWDKSAHTKNRRVVLRILEPDTHSIPYPEENANSSAEQPGTANIAH